MDREQTTRGGNEFGSTEGTPVQGDQAREKSRQQSQQGREVPATIPGYEVLRCLGEGSFGTVWLGRERKTGRQVAIKFFTRRRGVDWTLLTREVEKLAALDASRDVVRLLDVGVDHDPPYFVMEYLPHRSVAVLLQGGPVSVTQAIDITRSVARALVHAHSAGILHCDIKPGNVLLDHGDSARLGDFGQSRLANELSSSLGTFYYMAPEQAQRNAIPDVRWDVYALGALFFHMLTGDPPYRTDEAEARLQGAASLDERLAVYRQILAESPFPTEHHIVEGVDSELAELVDECLQRDPAERIPNPQVILDRLQQYELNKARRPYIWLGVLVPVLFLIASLWIAWTAIPAAVTHAEHKLAEQALSGDQATVRLLASSIQGELLDRQAELERLAARLTPRDNPQAEGFRDDLIDVMDRWRETTDERFRKQQRTLDESVFITDETGMQFYRSPWTDSIGRSFAYRDYFHGQGHELSPTTDDVRSIKPRTESGISQAFRSSNTGRFMVAIAVPMWSGDKSKVIGVLARTIHLDDLLDQWERRINERQLNPENEDPTRLMSLVDMRASPPLILDHHWLSTLKMKDLTDRKASDNLQLTPEEAGILRKAVADQRGLENYRDALADTDPRYNHAWLAAVARTPEIDWIAVVQERQDLAIAPMSQIYWLFLRYGLLLLLVFFISLIALWWFLRRMAAK